MNERTLDNHPFLILGDWKPTQSEEEFSAFLNQLKQTIVRESCTFYAATPFTWPDQNGNEEFVVIGSRSLMRISDAFPPSIAFSSFKKSKMKFVLLNYWKEKKFGSGQIKKILDYFLEEKVQVILNLNEFFIDKEKWGKEAISLANSNSCAFTETMKAALKEELEILLANLSEEAVKQLIIVIPHFPDIACRLADLAKEFIYTQVSIRSYLREILGDEKGKIVPFLAPIPRYLRDENIHDLIRDTAFNGFFFTQLPEEKGLVLKIIQTISHGEIQEETKATHSNKIERQSEKVKMPKQEEEVLEEDTHEEKKAENDLPSESSKRHTMRNLTSWGES